ncbi:hypothetical protein H2198_009882 [Neophaeococcomyces mojaviensis]|uniref:Uncharacterized protein n=1 Tax=Neophaeococcomyces mojaviensis TaxID=3383035 RepID=A0ACC2ZT38_9EURO|nr:hypothetical protein H2198_009882 [Knufia sp. JES_112]
MERSLPATGHYIQDIHINDRARVHIGDQIGCTTINSKVTPLLDFDGVYAHNALAPVSTYVDRVDLRSQLETHLHNRIAHASRSSQIEVVHGIGGAGKTQLVLDYIQRHRQDYSAVFWIEAGSRESIERDYIQIYILLYNLHLEAAQGAIEVHNAVAAVKRWFYGRGKRWLFVFDSADAIREPNDPFYVDLRRFLPDDPSIHVILTTRDRCAQDMTELPAVIVEEMTRGEAVTLFQKQAMILAPTSQQEGHIGAIVQELGYLALAITLAGSYVAATPRLQRDLAYYLPEYRERRRELLTQRPLWLVHQYGESVLTTWETTFRTIERQHPQVCHFLALLSFLNRDDIPADFPTVLVNGEAPMWVGALFPGQRITQYDIEAFFRTLINFSLIKYRGDQNSYAMHSLVQTWAYDRLVEDQQKSYGCICAVLLQVMTKTVQDANPLVRARTVTHIVSSFHKISQCFKSASVDDNVIVYLLYGLARFLDSCGQFKDEVVMERFIYQKHRSGHGDDHPDTLMSMNNLAATLREVGELQEALSIQRAVLEKRQQILGEDHPDTLMSMGNLAAMLGDVGELQEALSIQRAVLEKRQQILGEDHPDTLMSMNNLAATLREVGELQESLSMKRAVLEKHQQVRGEDHPDTLMSMNNLANTLGDVGELQEALSIQRVILEKCKQILGEDHPNTLGSMSNLANTLGDAGELQEALSIQREAVRKLTEVLGVKHPFTIKAEKCLLWIEQLSTDTGQMQ